MSFVYLFNLLRTCWRCCCLISFAFLFSCEDPLPDYSTTVPDAPDPSSIKITNITDQSATINWAAVEGADSYRVYLSYEPDFLVLEDSFPKNIVEPTFTPKGLLSGATYTVKVKALSKNNGISEGVTSSFTTTSSGDEYIYAIFGNSVYKSRANNQDSFAGSNFFNFSSISNIFPLGGSSLLLTTYNGLTVIDRHKGTTLWTFLSVTPTAIPFLSDNVLFIGSSNNELAIDATTGKLLYTFSTNGTIKSTPFAAEEKLFFTSTDGYLYCINSTNGQLIWKKLVGGINFVSSPAVVNGLVVVGSDNGNVYGMDANAGNEQWRYVTNGPVLSSPTIGTNNNLYIGSDDANLYCLTLAGRLVWSITLQNRIRETPVWHSATSSTLVTEKSTGKLLSFNGSTGNKNWEKVIPNGASRNSPCDCFAPLVAGSQDIYIFSPNGTILQRVKGDGASIAITKGWYSYNPSVVGSPVVYDGSTKSYYVRTPISF